MDWQASAILPWILPVAFALVTGSNDGGAIIAGGMRIRSLRALGSVLLLTAGVVATPLLLGTEVAQTFARDLVPFHQEGGATAFMVGISVSIVLVFVLTRLGRPTSLTLAVIGGLAGAGLGSGLPVSWGAVGIVLVFGVAAPLVGAAGGFLLAMVARLAPSGWSIRPWTRVTAVLGYAAQCLAYGLNDGQKMLAVFAVTVGSGALFAGGPARGIDPGAGEVLLIGGLFFVGSVISLRRVSAHIGDRLMQIRRLHLISAELASAGAVLGSAVSGMPVSMAQSIVAGLVGAGSSQGKTRVRWRATIQLMTAWIITLPASVILAASVAALVGFLD